MLIEWTTWKKDNFLETYNFSTLNQEEIEIVSRSVSSTEIKIVMKKSPLKQNSKARGCHRQILSNI